MLLKPALCPRTRAKPHSYLGQNRKRRSDRELETRRVAQPKATGELGWVCRTTKVRCDWGSHQDPGTAQLMPSPQLQTPKADIPAAWTSTSDLPPHWEDLLQALLSEPRGGTPPLKGAGATSHLPSQLQLCIGGTRENSSPCVAEGQDVNEWWGEEKKIRKGTFIKFLGF